ncbi:MAG: alpha/beta fold hydrolase [Bdellovibrionaceae bacterium]|nr:alpha/beta fold hydrolase [Pseudobdellovibrionaceae bacterium]
MKNAALLALIFGFIFSAPMLASTDAEGEPQIGQRPNLIKFIWETSKFYLSNRWKQKEVYEAVPDLKSHYEFLAEKRSQNNSGKMTSYFDTELQTRIYYAATAKPDRLGNIPVMDPLSKGLVIYFHGSGTENGSGANFNYKGNKLSTLGYSSVSMDYPFHRDGPINSKYGEVKLYSEYILQLIQKFRIEGKPVVLVGHSFGVNIIAEFITRYPFAADAAVLLSPAGFNEDLATWAKEKTSLMLKSFPHFSYNELGARWAGFINRQFTWSKESRRKFKDPTLVNPKLHVRVVSGEWEEFVPGPLDENGLPAKQPRTYDILGEMKKFFSRATTVMEPGVGHLIHSHTDVNGQDLILREILAANGEQIADAKEIADSVNKERKKILTEIDQGIHKQKLEPFFREWLAGTYGSDYIKTLMTMSESDGTALVRRVLGDFKKFEDWRATVILANLKESRHPFYIDNQEQMDSTISSKNLNERTKFVNAYYIYLTEHPEAQKVDRLNIDPVNQWVLETAWDLKSRTQINVQSEAAAAHKKTNQQKSSRSICISFYQRAS